MASSAAVEHATTQRGESSSRAREVLGMSGVDVFERQGPHSASWQHDEQASSGSSEDGEHRNAGIARSYEQHGHHDDADEAAEDLDEYDAQSSAFTNPSWYGSPSQRRDSVIWGSRRGSQGAGPSSSAATSPITSPPTSKRGMAWSTSGSGGKTSPRGSAQGKTIQEMPRQVLAYRAALAKVRNLLVDEEEEGHEAKQQEPQPPPIEKDEPELDVFAAMSALGSLLPRRWAASSTSTSLQQQHMTSASKAVSSLGYAPTSAAAFDDMPTYRCATCGITLALQDELISKAFSGRDGKAFLFFSVLNARAGAKEDRHLITGLHTVADLTCVSCDRNIGWTYVRAYEASQRYKEGKFILERASLHKSNHW